MEGQGGPWPRGVSPRPRKNGFALSGGPPARLCFRPEQLLHTFDPQILKMNRLKQRWGITSNLQLAVILIVFAITGSSSVYVARPVLAWIGLQPGGLTEAWWGDWLYWTLRILVLFPIYQVLLIAIGWVFGQFGFFWNFEKKMLRRMGLGFLFRT